MLNRNICGNQQHSCTTSTFLYNGHWWLMLEKHWFKVNHGESRKIVHYQSTRMMINYYQLLLLLQTHGYPERGNKFVGKPGQARADFSSCALRCLDELGSRGFTPHDWPSDPVSQQWTVRFNHRIHLTRSDRPMVIHVITPRLRLHTLTWIKHMNKTLKTQVNLDALW